MATTLSYALARRNARLNSGLDSCNSGYLRIYDGIVPADADAALSGNTLLAELTFGVTAFGAASSGSKTANAITQDASANNTGVASFFRLFASDGTTVVCQGSVGTAGEALNLNTTSITAGVQVQVTSFVVSEAG